MGSSLVGIEPFDASAITPVLVSFLCGLVVRALYQHCKGVGSTPAEQTYS